MAGSQVQVLLDRYRLIDRIGRGGMGAVWRGHDDQLGRPVAVKEIYLSEELDATERAERRRRVVREARAAARLRHTAVVSVYDVIEQDGRPWIIMELVESRSLEEVIKADGPLPPRRAAQIGLRLLDALQAAHRAGVIHRDVKPANVLIGADERVVLSDFGIATYDGASTLTRSGMVLGSPAYMAPEIAQGARATSASDLWSLGATLHAAVEGRSPYERDSAFATVGALLTQDPDPPRRAGPLRPVIEGLLRKEPARRLSPRRTRALLTRVISEGPVQLPAQFPGWARRRPRLVAAAAAFAGNVVVIMVVVIGITLRSDNPPQSGARPSGAPHAAITSGAPRHLEALVLRAKGEDCRAVVITLPNGGWLFNGTLQAGQVLVFDEPRMNLSVYSGDACEVTVNGRRQPSGDPVGVYEINKPS